MSAFSDFRDTGTPGAGRCKDDRIAAGTILAGAGRGAARAFCTKTIAVQSKKAGSGHSGAKRDLIELISYHKISFDTDVESLTKSEASRMIDKIYAAYGRGHVKKERI